MTNMSKKKTITKKKFDVDVLVALFIRKTVTAKNEEEANKKAEDSIDFDAVQQAYDDGDVEIEVTGTEEAEND